MDQGSLTTLLAVVLTRATERILIVLVGALSIYLGYRLFKMIAPTRRHAADGETKIELPGGVSIFLTRVGPGVFFALFGAALIGWAGTKPIEFNPPNAATIASARPIYSGVGDATPVLLPVAQAATGLDPATVVARLNGAFQEAQRRLDPPAAAELGAALRAAKYAVLLRDWKPEWGDRGAFDRWVRENGHRDPPPDEFPKVIPVFRGEL
jgi:branched-subunit amino acid transport protein